jgi:hypothetical protein
MSVTEFFVYLAAHAQTRELAIRLADAWARAPTGLLTPAA